MFEKISKLLNSQYRGVPIVYSILAILATALILLPAIRTDHTFYNLEPYPDSFTYIIPALNLVQGQGFTLQYGNVVLIPNIFSTYSLVLLLFLAINSSAQMILIANATLFLLGVIGVYSLGKEIKLSHWQQIFVGTLYIGHVTTIWLAGLAMTENIAVPLLIWSLYFMLLSMTKPTALSWREVVISQVLIASLFLSRLSLIPVAVMMFLYWFGWLIQQKKYGLTVIPVVIAATTYLSFSLLQGWMKEDITIKVLGLEQATQHSYYSIDYLVPNLLFYTRVMFGVPGVLLWEVARFTVVPVTIISLVGYASRTIKMTWQKKLVILFLGALSVSTLGVFYHQDIRYVQVTLPFLILGVMWGVQRLAQLLKPRWFAMVMAVTLVCLCVSQQHLVEDLIRRNVLFTSRAWQYESIQHFNDVLSKEDNLITALPPYLSTVYTTAQYRWLPLSLDQEYAQKQKWIWGDLRYEDLFSEYSAQLLQGKKLYISNAYVTHNHTVIADFEKYKSKFNLQLVSEGCLQACNIYQLSLKSSESTPSSELSQPLIQP